MNVSSTLGPQSNLGHRCMIDKHTCFGASRPSRTRQIYNHSIHLKGRKQLGQHLRQGKTAHPGFIDWTWVHVHRSNMNHLSVKAVQQAALGTNLSLQTIICIIMLSWYS